MSDQLSCGIYPYLPSPLLHHESGEEPHGSTTSLWVSLPCFVGVDMRHIQEGGCTQLDSSLLTSQQEAAFHLCVTAIQ